MRKAIVLAVLLGLATSGPALAGNKGKGKGQQQQKAAASTTAAVVSGLISAVERAIVSDYIAANRGTLPSALAGAQPLPPGIAKKLARGGSLPPGIAKKQLPGGLVSSLPSRPGEEWLVIGTDLVVVKISTNTIVDVLKNVL